MAYKANVPQYKANLQAETNSSALYRVLAETETKEELQKVYLRLAETEEKHASFWREQILKAGGKDPLVKPDWRTKILIFLAKKFGPQFVLPTLVEMEETGSDSYSKQPETKKTNMVAEEKSHGRLFKAMMNTGGLEGTQIARFEGRHKGVGGNALRAAVLGANDGLVSNLSLVMGVAGAAEGAALSNGTILITGFAGLLAGAISMALGEWLSVQSSRELYQRQMSIEESELASNPQEEMEELALIYQSKGISEENAKLMASQLVSNPNTALDTLAREELGIDPEELGGSAWEAAGMSFVLFSFGAIIPVIPFIITSGSESIILSLVLSALGLFGIGSAITVMTGKSIWSSGTRQLIFGLLAAGVTFGIGWFMGVSLAG
ncbi:MAG: rubrerythrin family protein [Ignavibacteria bacterium]|jgi:VIT1/CCC1 family predicted Fe2+/Mn2+ transporter|nr:rubrerythrin family protein [Ignavibacteria bacterium]MCU7497777.1 rubrerythrin family protein [Ignavibacteria bacterium]MCU7510918.1 rubrerythrin family protein [Ignavibacteria bacterium]MCU7518772.1 rubrerythrin family protein [Ignavibacteria bacterium]MCU7522825.1 rubrerythrin family protein [Ignavibacteria bacterium]